MKNGKRAFSRRQHDASAKNRDGVGGSYDEADLQDHLDGGGGTPLLLVSILTGEVKVDRLRELWPNWAAPFRTGNGGNGLGIRLMEPNEPMVAVRAAHR